jgi:uncharacterized protein YraI
MFARRMCLNPVLFLLVSTLVLSACNLMIEPTPAVTPLGKATEEAIYTAAAQTIAAQLTQSAGQAPSSTSTPLPATELPIPTESAASPEPEAAASAVPTATPQATAAPQATALPAATATPQPAAVQPSATTAAPTIVSTATPAAALISASINTNCRSGPGPQYKLVGYLVVGKQSEVLARNLSGSWWYIRNPSHAGQFCWVWAQTTQVSGDTAAIPVYSSLSSQTPAVVSGPAFKIESVNLTSCDGLPAAAFGVKNTGTVRFESASLVFEDLTSELILLQTGSSDTPFRGAIRGCPAGEGSLALNSMRFIGGPLAQTARHAHDGRVTIQMCTQDGLAGVCVQRSADFVLP